MTRKSIIVTSVHYRNLCTLIGLYIHLVGLELLVDPVYVFIKPRVTDPQCCSLVEEIVPWGHWKTQYLTSIIIEVDRGLLPFLKHSQHLCSVNRNMSIGVDTDWGSAHFSSSHTACSATLAAT